MSSPPSSNIAVIVAVTADKHGVCVRITGDVDLMSASELDSLAQQLAAAECSCVYLDLAGITFAGSTFINFVFRLTRQMPHHHPVVLCRPTPLLRRVIALTTLDQHTEMRADLPHSWTITYADAEASTMSLTPAVS